MLDIISDKNVMCAMMVHNRIQSMGDEGHFSGWWKVDRYIFTELFLRQCIKANSDFYKTKSGHTTW